MTSSVLAAGKAPDSGDDGRRRSIANHTVRIAELNLRLQSGQAMGLLFVCGSFDGKGEHVRVVRLWGSARTFCLIEVAGVMRDFSHGEERGVLHPRFERRHYAGLPDTAVIVPGAGCRCRLRCSLPADFRYHPGQSPHSGRHRVPVHQSGSWLIGAWHSADESA